MTTLYRICTEDMNRPGIESILQTAKLDATLLSARGLYKGTAEHSLVIECATEDANAITIAALSIKILNNQREIMIQTLPVSAVML